MTGWMRVVMALVFLVLAGCSTPAANTPPPAPTAPPLAADKGGMAGQVTNTAGVWEETPLYVYAAAFYGDDQKRGFYMLDPLRDPTAELSKDGLFQLSDLKPQKYVLVVGPTAEQGRLVVDEKGQTRIFTVTAGEVLTLGAVAITK